jgi:DNA-binding XRE family transcriptional regulator
LSNLSKRVLEIRIFLDLGRTKFAKTVESSTQIIRNIETERSDPSANLLEKICLKWPHYSLWLMTGTTQEENGQISPDIERIRRDSEKGKVATG